jgi:hypothetical protein
MVAHDAYVPASKMVVVSSGRPDSSAYQFALLPKQLAQCQRNKDHAVVVGYFRPPAAAPQDTDLASRIADALNYELLTRIQQLNLSPDLQPFVLACKEALPQASSDHTTLARALRADAFLSGYVAPSGALFKVEMTVADRFDLLVPPVRTSSRDVNLDDPAAARLDRSAHQAILRALIAGYAKAGQHTACVEVSVAAERILGALPDDIAEARRHCQSGLPNRALLGGPP